jgi:hypothetical protein
MARRAEKEEVWFQEVAGMMARESSLTLRQAALRLGLAMSPEEAQLFERRKEFQRILLAEQIKYYDELGSDPRRTKNVLLGQMVYAIQKLLDESAWDKALAGGIQLAKVAGWVGAESEVNIIEGLSQKDLEEVRAKLKLLSSPVSDTTKTVN